MYNNTVNNYGNGDVKDSNNIKTGKVKCKFNTTSFVSGIATGVISSLLAWFLIQLLTTVPS